MSELERQLQQWTAANLLDQTAAARIRQFEQEGEGRKRWPFNMTVSFGTFVLAAGILLFVAAHWDEMSPSTRFISVLSMVAVLHLAATLLSPRLPAMGVALHAAGTIALGGGIYLAGQIFNLEEHWPSGILLWALGAGAGWLILRQWPQALLAALLVPWWLAGEWEVMTARYQGQWNIAAQGLLLLAILFISIERKQRDYLRLGLVWAGAVGLVPLIFAVVETAGRYSFFWASKAEMPVGTAMLGYAGAYLPTLLIAVLLRKWEAGWMFVMAAWVAVLATIGSKDYFYREAPLYCCMAIGASALCWWGIRANRKLLINYGCVLFVLTVTGFYFSDVLDKMGRAVCLMLAGVLLLAVSWVLGRLQRESEGLAAAAEGGR